jgi:hypothetical protein
VERRFHDPAVAVIGAESVTVQRAARRTDSSGALTPQRDWENATSVTLTATSVQPDVTAETRDAGGVEVTAQWRLFTRDGAVADLRTGDRVVWDGRSLDVVGDPQRWAGPNGGTHHWEVVLREQPVTRSGAVGVSAVLADATRETATQMRPWTP